MLTSMKICSIHDAKTTENIGPVANFNSTLLTRHLQQPVSKRTLAMIHVSHYAKIPNILS